MEQVERASQILRRERIQARLKLGVPGIDEDILEGGLFAGKGIVELVGEASSGKTSLALQLCVECNLQQQGQSIYLNTEGPFPFKRLEQISNHQRDVLDSIFVRQINRLDELLKVLSHDILQILDHSSNIRLLVLDSIASILRSDTSCVDYRLRAQHIFSIGSKLRSLSHRHGLVILVLNQVSDVMDLLPLRLSECRASSNRMVKPALGPSWSSNVFLRIFLTKQDSDRQLFVVRSSYLVCPKSCRIRITESGIALPPETIILKNAEP